MTLELSFLPAMAAMFMLMFARLGTMVMLLPALGESSIPGRMRLTIALAVTLVLYPMASRSYPADLTTNLPQLGVLLAGEFLIGFAIGLSARMITAALQIAGTIIASQIGLAFAMGSDLTNSGQQGALIGNYLSILAVTLVFVTDAHFLIIAALHDSFTLFPPGDLMPVGDFTKVAVDTFAHVFSIAVRMSAPFIVVGLVFYFGLGLLNKLMPQMQIFFISMPVNITLGIVLLLVLIGTIMSWYLTHFAEQIGRYTAG
ncbi:flagellar biosynthetic protein FliR [Pannonibacter sp.]|uniref:flagellar biosynthetic protein FliR n=1 Tax=Pannonibacter sp. TaxID=1906786 RepID=UPI003F7244AD